MGTEAVLFQFEYWGAGSGITQIFAGLEFCMVPSDTKKILRPLIEERGGKLVSRDRYVLCGISVAWHPVFGGSKCHVVYMETSDLDLMYLFVSFAQW